MDYKKTDKKLDDEDGQSRDANASEACSGKNEGMQSNDNNKDVDEKDNENDSRVDDRDDNEIAIADEEEILHFEYDDPEMQHDYTIILEPERATAIEKKMAL